MKRIRYYYDYIDGTLVTFDPPAAWRIPADARMLVLGAVMAHLYDMADILTSVDAEAVTA